MLALFALALLSYFISLSNQFMLDDFTVLFGERGVSNKSLLELFTSYQHIFYRPVGHIFLLICYHLFGENVVPYHCANLFLFFIITVLFYHIVFALTRKQLLAFLTASLFCLHPINSMLVNYVTANIISTFVITLQLSFLFYVKYLDSRNKKFFYFSIGCFLLSLFSHEMSMMFPAYIFCLLYFIRKLSLCQALVNSLPIFLVSFCYLVFRLNFFSLQDPISASTRVMAVFDVYLSSVMQLIYWYCSKLLFPKDILFLMTHPASQDFFPYEIWRVLCIAAILGYLIFFRLKKGILPFALSIFIFGLLPCFWASYAHFPFVEPIIEPHWFYFSSLGFFILLAQGLLYLKEKFSRPLVASLLCVTVVSYFMLLQQNNRQWKDQASYCHYWLSLNQANVTPYYGLGKAALNTGDFKSAIFFLSQGLALSNFHSAFITADLGYAYFLFGDNAQALHFYQKTLNNDPDYSVTYYYLAFLEKKEGKINSARDSLNKAINLYPRDERYHKALAEIERQRY